MESFMTALLALCVSWTLWNLSSLYRNYVKVRRLGLPIIVCPVSPDNPLWIAFQAIFRNYIHRIPLAHDAPMRNILLGWQFHDRYKTHQKLGDAFILATPRRNCLYIADAKAVTDVFNRGKDFKRPLWLLEPLNVFGPNVATAEGKDWQRQRRLTSAPFNEQKNVLVWNESISQACDMLEIWTSKHDGLTSTQDDTRTLALHVLSYVAFRRSHQFKRRLKPEATASMSYSNALAIILQNAAVVLVLPRAAFSLPFMPWKWKQVGWAIENFRSHMMEQIREEQALLNEGQMGSDTLVGNLLRASTDATAGDKGLKPLTTYEILGNMFFYNFAGHDTTAVSLAYAILLLAANPSVQDWVHEELEHYLKDADVKRASYADTFPKLKRCLSILLETLRLYTPVPGIPKYTGQNSARLSINSSVYLIPANTMIIGNVHALQTFPRHWGTDSLVWRPQRWISNSTIIAGVEHDELYKPPKGVYFPWSEGVRNCPGKKFAQVEFVAVMAVLFRRHFAEPVTMHGEPLEKARLRVLDIVNDSNIELLLQMRNPEGILIKWNKKK